MHCATSPGEGGGEWVGPGSYSPRRVGKKGGELGELSISTSKRAPMDPPTSPKSRLARRCSFDGVLRGGVWIGKASSNGPSPGPGAYGASNSKEWDECTPRGRARGREQSQSWARAERVTTLGTTATLHGGVIFSPTRKDEPRNARVGPGAYLSLSPKPLLRHSFNTRARTGNSPRAAGASSTRSPTNDISVGQRNNVNTTRGLDSSPPPPPPSSPRGGSQHKRDVSMAWRPETRRAVPYIQVIAKSPIQQKKGRHSSLSPKRLRSRRKQVASRSTYEDHARPCSLSPRYLNAAATREAGGGRRGDRENLSLALQACDDEMLELLGALEVKSQWGSHPLSLEDGAGPPPPTPLSHYNKTRDRAGESCSTPSLFNASDMEVERFYNLGNWAAAPKKINKVAADPVEDTQITPGEVYV